MGRIRVLSNRISFHISEQQESGRFDPIALGTMDYSGHMDIYEFSHIEKLADLGMAREQRVDVDGGVEVFASDALLDPLRAAFRQLPEGWQDWPFSDRRNS